MDNLAHSEIFALTLVIGTYLTSLALYKKADHPLAGMYLQRKLESKAFVAGGENYNAPIQRVRSEERRVGKECRSRWSPYH